MFHPGGQGWIACLALRPNVTFRALFDDGPMTMPNAKKSTFAAQFERSSRDIERLQMLKPVRSLCWLLCCALVGLAAVHYLFIGKDDPALYLALGGMLMTVPVITIDTYASKARERAQEVMDKMVLAENASRVQKNASNPAGKIPLTVGFINLLGRSKDKMLMHDAAALSEIFQNTQFSRTGAGMNAQVLLVYGLLDAQGNFDGRSGLNLRQLAQQVHASIAILAWPNAAEHVQVAASSTGPKVANLVFTLDRCDPGFVNFFTALFKHMGGGEEMLQAWVALAPQGPSGGGKNAPATMLVAEAGKIAFAR